MKRLLVLFCLSLLCGLYAIASTEIVYMNVGDIRTLSFNAPPYIVGTQWTISDHEAVEFVTNPGSTSTMVTVKALSPRSAAKRCIVHCTYYYRELDPTTGRYEYQRTGYQDWEIIITGSGGNDNGTTVSFGIWNYSMNTGGTLNIMAHTSDNSYTGDYRWESDNTSVCTVTSRGAQGTITAIRVGIANIRVYLDNGNYDECEVVVKDNDSQGFYISAIQDEGFRNYLKNQSYGIDGYISSSELQTIKDIDCRSLGIKSLEGIEKFHALTSLDCSDNEIDILDLSKNTNLTKIYCSRNNLHSLSVPSNKSTKPYYLYCSENKLHSLVLPEIEYIVTLDASNNQIEELDLSQCYIYSRLNVANNQIHELNIGRWGVYLKELFCNNNMISGLGLSKAGNLTNLNCSNNRLYDIDTSFCPKLIELNCSDNSLATISLQGNVMLERISCSNNILMNIDLSSNTKLTYLKCADNCIKCLDLRGCGSIVDLDCRNNSLEEIQFAENQKSLKRVVCYKNLIKPSTFKEILSHCQTKNDSNVYYWKMIVLSTYPVDQNEFDESNLSQLASLGWEAQYYDVDKNDMFIYDGKLPIITPSVIKLSTNMVEMAVSETVDISAKILPVNADQSVQWRSSDTKVAYVDTESSPTKIVAISEGTCEIYVYPTNYPDACQDTCKVIVKKSQSSDDYIYIVGEMTSWNMSDDAYRLNKDEDGIYCGRVFFEQAQDHRLFLRHKKGDSITNLFCEVDSYIYEEGFLDKSDSKGFLSVFRLVSSSNGYYFKLPLCWPGGPIDIEIRDLDCSDCFSSIWFTVMRSDLGAVDKIVNNENSDIEYFNINGLKVGDDTSILLPGIYVKRQGAKVDKVLIK